MFGVKGLGENGFYGIYYRGVTFDFTDKELQDFLSKYKEHGLEFSTEDEKCNVYCLKCKSEISPPSYFKKDGNEEYQKEDNLFVYFLIFIVFKCGEVNKCLLASHSEDILLAITEKEVKSFFLTDISELCNKNFKPTERHFLSIIRLSAAVNTEDDGEVTGMMFYGKDILNSKTIKLIMQQKDVTDNLFTKVSKENLPALLPNSCRLLFNDGALKFSLNTDRYGNFSFVITKEYYDNFRALAIIFKTITNLCCFDKMSTYNPLKRSARALKEVE